MAEPPDHKRVYCRPNEAKEVFGIHKSTLYRLVRSGELQLYKRGRATLFHIEEVTQVLKGQKA